MRIFRIHDLSAITFKGCTFRLVAFTCVGACHLNLVGMAFAGLVVRAGRSVAGNLRRLAWNIIRIAGSVIFSLTEAFAAGLVGHSRVPSAHMDVILTAGIILIIRTVDNRTI